LRGRGHTMLDTRNSSTKDTHPLIDKRMSAHFNSAGLTDSWMLPGGNHAAEIQKYLRLCYFWFQVTVKNCSAKHKSVLWLNASKKFATNWERSLQKWNQYVRARSDKVQCHWF